MHSPRRPGRPSVLLTKAERLLIEEVVAAEVARRSHLDQDGLVAILAAANVGDPGVAVYGVIATVREALAMGQTVQLAGLGSFEQRVRRTGQRRMPHGDPLPPTTTGVGFSPASSLVFLVRDRAAHR